MKFTIAITRDPKYSKRDKFKFFEIEGDDIVSALTKYVHKEYWVWDFDTCGDETLYVNVDDKRFFKIEHYWYNSAFPDGFDPENEFEIEELPERPEGMMPKRDWLII